MTMTVNYRDLCSTIVEDCYGDFYGLLFRQLAQHGRLSSSQLAQRCHLPLRQVKAGLAALVQLRLVCYHESPTQDLATYQANLDHAYNIIRTGKLVNVVSRELGHDAGALMSTACDLGFATVGELKARLYTGLSNQESKHEYGTRVDGVIHRLLENSFFVRVRRAQFQSIFDAQNDVEQFLKESGTLPKTTGAKAKAELEARVESEIRNRLNTATSELGYVNKSYGTITGLNGFGPEEAESPSQGLSNGTIDFDRLLVGPNFRKIVALTRSEYLHDAVEEQIGNVTATVLRSLVHQSEIDNDWQTQTEPIYRIDLDDLLEEVNERLARSEIGHQNTNTAKMNGTRHPTRDSISPRDIDRHLRLLYECSYDFLNDGRISDSWTLNRQDLQLFVQQREMLRLIEGKVKHPSPRILRMLMEKGKMEEKALQEIGLLGAKELRQSLAQLKKMGYVDLQEVPRDPQRQPNRTLFLWFHDREQVQQTILESIYITMIRLLQRLKLERQILSRTLSKVERQDVQGKEKQILPTAELETLNRFRRLEEWFWVELNRLDDSVCLLRGR